jgi:acyl-ACP thioesterase
MNTVTESASLTEHFKVRTREVDAAGRLKLSAVADYFQESAARHTESWGMGFSTLKAHGLFWVLSRMRIDMLSYPSWGEKLTLKTWPKSARQLIAPRDFILSDEAGKTVSRGVSLWFLLDAEFLKPQPLSRLPHSFQVAPDGQDAIDEAPAKVPAPKNICSSINRTCLNSNIDFNQHLNNAVYLDWISDALFEYIPEAQINSLQLNFLNELKLHEHITIDLADNNGVITVQGQKSDATTVFRAALTLASR